MKLKVEKPLKYTKKVALTSSYINTHGKQVRLGAAVFDKHGVLIASNVNQNKTHYLQKYYNEEMPFNRIPYLHAEIAALLKARWVVGEKGLKNCTVYVARKLNCDGWGLARPCRACRAAMVDMGIKKIVYTTEDGYCIENLEE